MNTKGTEGKCPFFNDEVFIKSFFIFFKFMKTVHFVDTNSTQIQKKKAVVTHLCILECMGNGYENVDSLSKSSKRSCKHNV